MKNFENLLNLLGNKNLSYYEFISKANNIEFIKDIFDITDIDMWRTLGLDIVKNVDKIELKTRTRNIEHQDFCIVDIETSGSVNSGQIIEIGAVKIRDGVEKERFESFVYADSIPESIVELTGISANDLKDAPPLSEVLEKFKHFLGVSVFVAHNVNFDYGFISSSLNRAGFGFLLNRKICTIELAKRTIVSPRYGLDALKELLGINSTHHRALSDALAACEIFKIALDNLPCGIKHTEELIKFSKSSNKLHKNLVQTPALNLVT